MDSQKNENLLNLALQTPEAERERSLELNVGYDEQERTWEVIVKYHDSLERLAQWGIVAEEMIAGYAILTVPESEIERLAEVEEIEYVEKPKRLFFSDLSGNTASCYAPGSPISQELTGKDVLVAVIDSGISYYNRDFRNEDGTTRIVYLWDQVLNREFSAEQINEALAAGSRAAAEQLVPSMDISGHGTAVAGIAAGNGGDRGQAYAGMARESGLLIVRLGAPKEDSFPRTTELMRALTYVVKKAVELKMPVAVNLSFGNTYGAHNGTSLLERFINNVSEIGRSVICVGSGNEGASGGHVGGSVRLERMGLNVQLWKEYTDRFLVTLVSPSGERFQVDTDRPGKQIYRLQQTQILLYNGEPAPYMTPQEIYFDFLPVLGESYLDQGVWTFVLRPVRITTGNYTFYLPSSSVRNANTRFVRTTPDVTLTIPSTAGNVITVGAYDPVYGHFLCRAFCHRGGRSADAVGHCYGKRSLPVRGEGEGVSSEGGAADPRRGGVPGFEGGVWVDLC